MNTNGIRKHYENALNERKMFLLGQIDLTRQTSYRWQDIAQREWEAKGFKACPKI